jgi:FKBP-type peptidyl-prolyl cis-trans isomerase
MTELNNQLIKAMKNMNRILKIGFFLLTVFFAFSSCNKDTEETPSIYTAEREAGQIKDWLATMVNNKVDIDTTSTGLYYIVSTIGTGPTVKTGDTITVKYTGFFMDDTIFDASSRHGDGTYTYVHKDTNPKNRMIQGWEEAIEVLSKGSKAIFLIPSAKGYGPSGYGPVPPYTPLFFEIEVVNIK